MRKQILTTLLLLLTAGTAVASSYCYIDDFVVPADMMGSEIVVPVKAHFDARVQAFDVRLTIPEGITFSGVDAGSDLEVHYLNQRGRSMINSVTPYTSQRLALVQCATTADGYWRPDGADSYECYGKVKWEAGDYDEMLLLYLNVNPDFVGGEVTVTTIPTSTDDTRGGTVLESGDDGQSVSIAAQFMPETQIIPSPVPVVTFDMDESGNLIVKVQGEGEQLSGYILVNGEETFIIDGYDTFECAIEPVYDYGKVIEVHVTGQLGDYLPSEEVVFCYELSPKERPLSSPPEIVFEEMENGVMIRVIGNGELYGQVLINGASFEIYGERSVEYFVERIYDGAQEIMVTAYAIDGPEYVQSEEVTMQYVLAAKERPLSCQPVIVFEDMGDGAMIIVTGSGELFGQVLVNGQVMTDISGNGSFYYYVERVYDEDQEIMVTAYALEGPEYVQSEVVTMQYVLAAKERPLSTPPEIVFEELENGVRIMVTGNGELYGQVLVNDNQVGVISGYGSFEFYVQKSDLEYIIITVTAYALDGPEYQQSETITYQYALEPLPLPDSPEPVITFTEQKDGVLVCVDGNGELRVTISVNGDYYTRDEALPDHYEHFFPASDEPQLINVEAYNILYYYNPSPVVYADYTMPARTPVPQFDIHRWDALNEDNCFKSECCGVGVEVSNGVDGKVYWRVNKNEEGFGPWEERSFDELEIGLLLICDEPFAYYTLEVYAVADGYMPSETITFGHFVKTYETGGCWPYDFIEDDIYYMLLGDGNVGVTFKRVDQVTQMSQGHCYEGNVVIPATVTHDGVTYNVTTIGRYAFMDCDIESLTLPESITRIERGAFVWTRLGSPLVIPKSVSEIEIDSFGMFGPSHVTSVIVEDGNAVYDSRGDCNAIIETATNTLIAGCASTVIPTTVTSIGDYAFIGTGIEDVTIPEGVTSIGIGAFRECQMSSIVIPNTVITIGENAFSFCYKVSRIEIGCAVTEISSYAFGGNNSLKTVISHAVVPPTRTAGLMYNFDLFSDYESAALYVPAESVEAYRAHEEWGNFSRIVPFIGAGPGDSNGDGVINVSDVTSLIDLLLSGEDVPAWVDVNGDGVVNVSDVTTLIDQLLGGGQ